MEFDKLLHVAKKNEASKPGVSYYKAKLAPPKKEVKKKSEISANVKKFLEKKEEEVRRKALEEKRKKENLLSLRDQRAQNKINKHLKVCKSANKSAIADAVDNENTSVTMTGISQPDEDDYGYVSQESSAIHEKLMNMYKNLPPEKPLFKNDGKKKAIDIASTKDRVKEALKHQKEEEALGRRKKRKSSNHDMNEPEDKRSKENAEEIYDDETKEEEKPKPKKKPMPPPLNFNDLLKIAEKKQHEPIKIEVKPKKEEERLMTKKQMQEYAKEKEWRERKELAKKNKENGIKPSSLAHSYSSSVDKTVPKTSVNKSVNSSSSDRKNVQNSYSNIKKTVPQYSALPSISKKSTDRKIEKKTVSENNNINKNSVNLSEREKIMQEKRELEEMKRKLEEERRKVQEEKERLELEAEKRKIAEERKQLEEERRKLALEKSKLKDEGNKASANKSSKLSSSKTSSNSSNTSSAKTKSSSEIKPRQFPPSDVKSSKSALDVKPRQFPPPDVRPRQFPPADVRSSKPKVNGAKDKPRLVPYKRRVIHDDEEDEHDSELDDFIDDGPLGEEEDYSKYIKEIFNYDKSKYRYIDDEDDTSMETSFRQQQREEFISSKIGLMEDLEDIRKENEERKRKAQMKKGKR